MAYHYNGIAQTQTGKVIYRRKPHPFSVKDLRRINKAVNLPDGSEQLMTWLLFYLDATEKLRNWAPEGIANIADDLDSAIRDHIGSKPEFEPFGGGDFGGAGASGGFHWPWEGNPFETK